MEFVYPITDRQTIHDIYKYLRNKKSNGVRKDRDFLLFYCGIHLGLRITDLLKLEVKHFKGDFLRIKEKKLSSKAVRKGRLMKYSPEMKNLVYQYCRKNNIRSGFLFNARYTKRKLSRYQAYKIIKDIEKKFNLYNLGTHSLKKTFGYHFMEQYNEFPMLQKLFNHESAEQTLKYIGITQMKQDKLTERFII